MFRKLFKRKETTLKEKGDAALRLLEKGNFKEALPLLDEYISIIEKEKSVFSIEDVMFYWNRHVAKMNTNNVDGAITDLIKCTQICNFNSAYFELYRIYLNKGQSEIAKKYLVKAYEFGNKNAEDVLRKHSNYFKKR
jgi:tetratricopeptide (TPR) repeat protein